MSGGLLFFLCLNDRGGAEISMIRLAEGLSRRGHDVTLAVYGAHPELARALGFSGKLADLKSRRTFSALLPLVRLLRQGNFSHLIAALTHTNMAACAAAFLARRGTRVIVTEHGIDGVEACAASPVFALALRLLYARATALVAVSQGLVERWRVFAPRTLKSLCIYNPVIEKTDALPPAHQWLTQKNGPVIIGIGRLKAEKNFALLIRAFAQIKTRARLIILGEGKERASLEKLAQELGCADRILMPGFANINGFLSYADLLVCPSRREGFGNALVEALARGVPVVATDCPYGPADILQQGRYGKLVPVDDAGAMARAIDASLTSVPDAPSLRARGNEFTVDRCIDAYAALVDNS